MFTARVCSCLNQRLLYRSFYTSVRMAEEELKALKENPYYNKYATRIAQVQQTCPEEFLSRLEENARRKKEGVDEGKEYSSAGVAKPQLKDLQTKTKVLDDLMKVDLVKNKSASEISEIWTEHFKRKDCVCAVIPSNTYNKIRERSDIYSTFLLPLPRKEGFEFIMLQFSKNECHFCPLLSYQSFKENAPECLAVVFYTEFKDDKGIVLMHGQFDKNVLDSKEAAFLCNQLQLYYGQDNASRLQLLDTFTNSPQNFHHSALIQQLESINFVTG